MKFLIALIALGSIASTHAASIEGVYQQKTKVILSYADTKEKCKQDGGKYIGPNNDGYCQVPASNDATITKTTASTYTLKVNTVSTNINTCEFEGEGKLKGNVLTTTAKTEDYSSGEAKEVICTVKATFNKAGAMSLESSEYCSNFCGLNAYLDVGPMKKIK